MGEKSKSIPVFSREQYEYLLRVFPREDISYTDSLEKIMYNAGAQKVISLVESRVDSGNRVRVRSD